MKHLLIGTIIAGILTYGGMRLPVDKKVTTGIVEAVSVVPAPPSDYQIIQEIALRFHTEDRHTIKKMIDIAYAESGLRWNAENLNTNGTRDTGIFQINDVHTKRYGSAFKTDWRENINVAYKIYKQSGFGPWVAARKLGYIN